MGIHNVYTTEALKNADGTYDLYISYMDKKAGDDVNYFHRITANEMKSIIRTTRRWSFLKSRLVTPKEIIEGFKNPVERRFTPTAILFNARYNCGKALEGYDFFPV